MKDAHLHAKVNRSLPRGIQILWVVICATFSTTLLVLARGLSVYDRCDPPAASKLISRFSASRPACLIGPILPLFALTAPPTSSGGSGTIEILQASVWTIAAVLLAEVYNACLRFRSWSCSYRQRDTVESLHRLYPLNPADRRLQSLLSVHFTYAVVLVLLGWVVRAGVSPDPLSACLFIDNYFAY